MPTDPFVAPRLADAPRQEPNLAPGVSMPPSRAWRPGRPGDLPDGQPVGPLLGSPGPNIGYALTLARRVQDRLALAPHEHLDDAVTVVAALAMKRAASFGRAPVTTDVEAAMLVLGYRGGADPDFAQWRAGAIAHSHHEYSMLRRLCDAVDDEVLRLAPTVLAARAHEVQAHVRDQST